MARRLRLDPDGGWHHVMNRGLRSGSVFRDDDDRYRFVDELRAGSTSVGAQIAAYCCMGNHFHAVVHCPEGGLPELMRRLSSNYTRAFNRRHRLDGPLFRGRYAAVMIDDDPQLLVTTRYVHRNPLELGVAIEGYPWSGHAAYLNGSHPWLAIDPVLAVLGGVDEYREFVHRPMPADAFSVSDGVRSVAALPDTRPSLMLVDEVTRRVASPQVAAVDRRAIALVLALDLGVATASVVAQHFGMSSPGAVRTAASRARRRLAGEPRLAELVRSAEHHLTQAA